MPRYRNAGRPRGQAVGFTADQLRAIGTYLAKHLRNAALFSVAVSTALRASDLLSLRASDVLDSHGRVRERFNVNVRKLTTYHPTTPRRAIVTCYLSVEARTLLQAYIRHAGIRGDQLLWPMTGSNYRLLVKSWAAGVGLDPARYSGHSTRRTLPSLIYAKTRDVAAAGTILGHGGSLEHTRRYLGVDLDSAFDAAKLVLGE